MAKPVPCQLPLTKGIYWLKLANKTHCFGHGYAGCQCKLDHQHGWNWDNPISYGWMLAEVDPTHDSDYKITAIFGSDSIAKWDCDHDGVVVEIGNKIEEPK